MVQILRSQRWYREYIVKRGQTVTAKYPCVIEQFHIKDLDTALPLLIFFLEAYVGARVGDLHNKILLKLVKLHNTTI